MAYQSSDGFLAMFPCLLQVFAPKASSVILGNSNDASTSKMLLEQRAPGIFALTTDMPRVQETSVYAWFGDSPVGYLL